MKEGGSERKRVSQQFIERLAGKLETYFFAFGDDDFVAIVEGGDNVSLATASMIIGAAGGARVKVTVLLTPEEMDEAANKSGT